MSRPTEIQVSSYKNMSPGPYHPQVTNLGTNCFSNKRKNSLNEQVRGTFTKKERFTEYRINAYVKSNPAVGPGAHNTMDNFRRLKEKPCKVKIHKRFY